jgi:hypothetical protein
VLVVALSVLAALTLIGVVANNVQWLTDSDELAWQRLVDIWWHHGHGTAWVSPDVFITRYPLYAVFAAVGITARRGVVLASVLLNLGAGLAFVAGLLRSGELTRPLSRRVGVSLVLVACWAPVAWRLVFFNPNSRALEFGLAVFALAWLGAETARGGPSRHVALVACGGLALLWFSDPFVLYMVGGTAALVAGLDLFVPVRRAATRRVLGILGVSAVLALVIRQALHLVGFVTRPLSELYFTHLDQVPDRALLVRERLGALLGISSADLSTSSIDVAVVSWLRLGLVVLALVGVVSTLRRWTRASLLARTLTLCLVTTPTLVIFTNFYRSSDFVVDRYLGVFVVAVVGLAIVALDRLRGGVGMVAGVLVAVLVAAALVTNVHTWWNNRDASPDADVLVLSAAVESQRWDRVYGPFWLTVRADQLGQGATSWVQVECSARDALSLFRWHVDDAVLAGRPRAVAVALTELGCSADDLVRAYGKPSEQVSLEGQPFLVWRGSAVTEALRRLDRGR